MTLTFFEAIISFYRPFSFSLDFLQAFGYRDDDDMKMRSGYR